MLDDLLEAITQPEITAQDILTAVELARKHLDPRYKNLLFAQKEPLLAEPLHSANGTNHGNRAT